MFANIFPALPDECLRGYAFRLFSLNKRPLQTTANLLPGLATLTGIKIHKLIHLHCHVSYRRFVSDRYALQTISSHENLAHHCVTSASIPSAHAYYCSACIEDDIKNHGISYWRRKHHLPGVSHCAKHKIPLIMTNRKSMTSCYPQNATSLKLAISNEERYDYFSCPAIFRFASLSVAALHTQITFQPALMALLLARRFEELHPNTRRRFSELAHKSFPKSWLIRHFPGLFIPGSVVTERVSSLGRENPSTRHYLLALSLLWDDHRAALNACWFEHFGEDRARGLKYPYRSQQRILSTASQIPYMAST